MFVVPARSFFCCYPSSTHSNTFPACAGRRNNLGPPGKLHADRTGYPYKGRPHALRATRRRTAIVGKGCVMYPVVVGVLLVAVLTIGVLMRPVGTSLSLSGLGANGGSLGRSSP